jgi:hypothetical protein
MGSRFTGELILDILSQARSGVSIQELRKQYDFCKASSYHCRAKYDSGPSRPDSKRISHLEAQDARAEGTSSEKHQAARWSSGSTGCHGMPCSMKQGALQCM